MEISIEFVLFIILIGIVIERFRHENAFKSLEQNVELMKRELEYTHKQDVKELENAKNVKNVKNLENEKNTIEKIEKMEKILGINDLIPIRTQGYPESYGAIGTVKNEERTTILPLFGRRLSRNGWNYYCETNDFQKLKVGVHKLGKNCYSEYGCGELSDGDVVEIPELGNETYTITLHQNCVSRYVPFITC